SQCLGVEREMAGARKVVVAALQFACSDSVSENVDTAERLVRAAHKNGANIVLIQVHNLTYFAYRRRGVTSFPHGEFPSPFLARLPERRRKPANEESPVGDGLRGEPGKSRYLSLFSLFFFSLFFFLPSSTTDGRNRPSTADFDDTAR
ncbi:hypothetical protein BHE74_00025749, partial [Ensete ventricosum]